MMGIVLKVDLAVTLLFLKSIYIATHQKYIERHFIRSQKRRSDSGGVLKSNAMLSFSDWTATMLDTSI